MKQTSPQSAFRVVSLKESGISVRQNIGNEAKRYSNNWIAIQQAFLMGLLNTEGFDIELTLPQQSHTMKPFIILSIKDSNKVYYQDSEQTKKHEKDAQSIDKMIELVESIGYTVQLKKQKALKKDSKTRISICKRFEEVSSQQATYGSSIIERNGTFVYHFLKHSIKQKEHFHLTAKHLSLCEKYDMSIPSGEK